MALSKRVTSLQYGGTRRKKVQRDFVEVRMQENLMTSIVSKPSFTAELSYVVIKEYTI